MKNHAIGTGSRFHPMCLKANKMGPLPDEGLALAKLGPSGPFSLS
jgi:hypothetical protein